MGHNGQDTYCAEVRRANRITHGRLYKRACPANTYLIFTSSRTGFRTRSIKLSKRQAAGWREHRTRGSDSSESVTVRHTHGTPQGRRRLSTVANRAHGYPRSSGDVARRIARLVGEISEGWTEEGVNEAVISSRASHSRDGDGRLCVQWRWQVGAGGCHLSVRLSSQQHSPLPQYSASYIDRLSGATHCNAVRTRSCHARKYKHEAMAASQPTSPVIPDRTRAFLSCAPCLLTHSSLANLRPLLSRIL